MRIILFTILTLNSIIALAQYETEFTVALDGSGDFTSIQDAIDGSKSFPDKRITIFVKKGVYREKVNVHAWNTNLSIIGEDREKTIISWDDYFDKIDRGRNSTFFTATLQVSADDFVLKNISIENSVGDVGQAIALHIDADRVVIENCTIKGNQDTVYLTGERNRQYFKNCYIEGTTDYIFGGATAFFSECELYSKKDSYITAASTPQGVAFGFVFVNCQLTAPDSVSKIYLGRPWRNFAKTVFINCEMGSFVLREGWHNWGSPDKEKTTFYAEGNNKGPGAVVNQRVSWSHQLSKKEVANYSIENILTSSLDHPSKKKWYNSVNP